jgi:Predicted Zn-dependent protease (DUF2268)
LAARRAQVARAALSGLMLQALAGATHACPIVDATVTLSRIASVTAGKPDAAQIAAYRQGVIDRWPGLYTQEVLGLSPGAVMDRQIVRSLEAARRDEDYAELKQLLRKQIAATTAAFHVFPDFRCNFPIYFADTLGALDGAGRVVNGQRALVLGLGSLVQEQKQISLPVFLAHEFFHRYHFQAAGFSDDLENRQEIWRNLWAEGLATYMSEVLTPDATAAEALMLPRDLAQRAEPLTARMAAELLRGLDTTDEELFGVYFTSNPRTERHGIPRRAGYYVGYVVARRLAARHTLAGLAHLKGEELHREIEQTLRDLAAG